MANFYGFARSNYFRVKNLEKFKKAVEHCDVDVVCDNEDKKLVALLSNGEGGWNTSYYDEAGDCVEISIETIVKEHLKKGEVAIFMQIGYEKLRYLAGGALAINSEGKAQYVDINEIYEKAKILGKNITRAEY